jgi:putative effector of murein hydrolase LrgA (UPF0299 family)
MPGALTLLPVFHLLCELAEQVLHAPLPGTAPGMLLSFGTPARRLNGVTTARLLALTAPRPGAG